MTRKIAAMAYASLGIRTVRSTSEESGLVTSPEGERDEIFKRGGSARGYLIDPLELLAGGAADGALLGGFPSYGITADRADKVRLIL